MHLPAPFSNQPDDALDVAIYLLTPPDSPLQNSPPKFINEILSSLSKVPLARMEALSGHHLHHLVAINLSNGTRLVLKISPASTVLLLRHERHLLESEAAVCAALAKSSLPIPKVLKYEHEKTHLGAPFLLISRLDGITYADALPFLSGAEKSSIEHQIHAMRTVINQYTSPTFGLAGIPASRHGTYKHWREAFVSMMDAILMDGEDMMVNIPYFQIRAALSRWESYLDEVTEARLVVPDLGKPKNVLIDRKSNKVTGLLDFGSAVWGDPDLGAVEGKSDIKSLLYICYRATVTIVRNTYRAEDDAGELESRKILTNVLAQLIAG